MSYPSRTTDAATPLTREARAGRTESDGLLPGPPARGLLRIDEAAAWLGLSKRKTYELILRGELPSVHIGRSRRIALSALESFVRRLAVEPGHR